MTGEPFGVYLHWPFCAAKCPYCDFNSHVRHAPPDEARFAEFPPDLDPALAAAPILTTITDSDAASALMPGLAPQGRLLVVGVGRTPLKVSPGALVSGERIVQGAITGTPFENERTLDFSVLAEIRPMIETMPLARAFEEVKELFDPKGLLNPGKLIPTAHRCAEFGRMHVHRGELAFPDIPRF